MEYCGELYRLDGHDGTGVIGAAIGPADELVAAERYGLPDGLYIASVIKETDAWKQGLREGDIILEADGTPVGKTEELNDLKNKLQVGDRITLKIWRAGKELQVGVMLMDTNEVYK